MGGWGPQRVPRAKFSDEKELGRKAPWESANDRMFGLAGTFKASQPKGSFAYEYRGALSEENEGKERKLRSEEVRKE